MNRPFSLSLVVLAFLSPVVFAADLARMERPPLKKEPAYHDKPRYCLLVFGPEAATRVWLVQVGNTLYVDRNGNGDLTEPNKKVVAEKDDAGDDGAYLFNIGDIRDGPRLHKALSVYVSKIDHLAEQEESVKALLAKDRKARGYYVWGDVEMPGWKGTGLGGRVHQRAFYVDVNGVLQFADRPQDAPVIHFGGPWQIMLFGQQHLTIGREADVTLGVGTPGIGPGTTSWIDYDGVIPATVYPTLDITYPPIHPGESPSRERFELKRRC
jgi:hypothetical protein